MMRWMAITGCMGGGKSTLAGMLARRGCRVWEADAAVHALQAGGDTELCADIRRRFGNDVMDENKRVRRRVLAARVTGDPAALAALNAIVHPRVRRAFEAWRREAPATPADVGVAVVPLLFEAGWTAGWDLIVCVVCPPAEQHRRLAERGMSPPAIRFWTGAQWPMERKRAAADVVVDNSGSLPELERQAAVLMEKIKQEI